MNFFNPSTLIYIYNLKPTKHVFLETDEFFENNQFSDMLFLLTYETKDSTKFHKLSKKTPQNWVLHI